MHSVEEFLMSETSHSMLQHLVVSSLTTTSRSHYHESVAYLDRIVKLDNFHNELIHSLEIKELATVVQRRKQISIINLRTLNTWEQIKYNVFEEGKVILQELRDINIS